MDFSDSKESYSSYQEEGIDSSGCAGSLSPHPEDENMDLSDDEESSASSVASSVIKNLRFSGPARRQNWSWPDTIIFYMAKNPSTPKLYQKLIQSCKYFFLINPIIICSDLALRLRRGEIDKNNDANNEDGNNEETNDESAAVNVTDDYWEIKQFFVNNKGCYGFYKTAYKKIDLKNYSAKIWIVDSDDFEDSYFKVHPNVTTKNVVSSIISKIDRCNVKSLERYHQNLSFAEFSFLATSAIEISLENVTVKYDNGTVVPLEKIVECATKATSFVIDDIDTNISSETVKNLLEISHFSNIASFYLKNIPDSFDIETIFTYLKKQKYTRFYLDFSDSISAAYKKRLEKIVDEILEDGGRGGYKSPIIEFPGNDDEKLEKMYIYVCNLDT